MINSFADMQLRYMQMILRGIELRANPYHDEKGLFTSAGNSSGKSSAKGLTRTPKNGTIRLDMNGVPFDFPTVKLPKAEYARVCSEISTNWHTNFKGVKYGRITLRKKEYYFENRHFGDYNIYKVEKR